VVWLAFDVLSCGLEIKLFLIMLEELHGFSVLNRCLWTVCAQEPFVQACASFLVVRCPQLVGKEDQTTSKSHQLPAETIATMLGCLQACCAYVLLSNADHSNSISLNFLIHV